MSDKASVYSTEDALPWYMRGVIKGIRQGTHDGLQIFITNALYETHRKQIRFPRSKRKRTRAKWAKRPENYKTWRESKSAVRIGGAIWMTPEMWMNLKKLSPEADRKGVDCQAAESVLASIRPMSIIKTCGI